MNLRLFSLLILWCPLLAWAQPSLKRGEKLVEERRFNKAIDELAQVVGKEPENAYAHYLLGYSFLQSTPKSKAEYFLSKAVELDKTKNLDFFKAYAQALHFNEKFDEAIKFYSKADPRLKNLPFTNRAIKQCQNGKKLVANPKKFVITNMGPTVNTAYSEYLPMITADQLVMFFTSRRGGTTGGIMADDGQPNEDIYMVYNNSGRWSQPEQLRAPINTKDNDACIGISQYAQTMFIYRGRNGGDIYISTRKGDSWTEPQPFEHNTPGFESSAALSQDGKQLFFVSDRYGNKDIFVCNLMSNGRWNRPLKLLGTVNTHLDEESPFLHPDGKTLYFSSKAHSSMGGYDIFRVPMKGIYGSGEPENLGYPLNTAGDDLYFSLSPDGEMGYFSSEKDGGFGRQDLYMVRMPPAPRKPDVTLLKGVIKDEATGKPTDATVIVSDNETNTEVARFTTNAANGEYLLSVPNGKNYAVTVTKNKRIFHSENVSTSANGSYASVTRNITVKVIKYQASVILNNCFYETNKAELVPASFAELNLVAAFLKENPEIKIEVAGHTDNVGSDASNQALSLNRANSVRNYLISHGVAADRLVSRGYSFHKPIATNATPEGRAQNRRTEMVVISGAEKEK